MILLPLILYCKSSFSSKSSTTNVNGTTVPAGCPSSMSAVVPAAEMTGVSSITSSILTVRLAVVLSPFEVALHKYEKMFKYYNLKRFTRVFFLQNFANGKFRENNIGKLYPHHEF